MCRQVCEKIIDNFISHNIFQRVEILWNELESSSIMTLKQINKYEKIDREIFRLCANAENKIKGKKHNKYVWSPVLDSAVRAVQYWKKRKKCFTNDKKPKGLIDKGISNGMIDNTTLGYI